MIPLHPWQLALSPVIRELLKRKWIAVLDQRIAAVPLASQRTCRILKTGFDVKLPVAVTLTGEDRLIYPLNRANAVRFLFARPHPFAGQQRSPASTSNTTWRQSPMPIRSLARISRRLSARQ